MDRLEQERLKRMTRAPGADRATRVDDMSSDEDDVSAQGNNEIYSKLLASFTNDG